MTRPRRRKARNDLTGAPLRVALIVPWITKGRGGTENVGHMMANQLALRGHSVDLFTFDDDRQPSRWPLDARIRLHWLEQGDSPAADSRIVVALAQALPDVILGLHMNRTFLRYTDWAARLDVPVVLSEHIDPHFPQRIGATTREERETAFAQATAVHLLVDQFRADLPAHLAAKAHVIPNTIPPARAQADPAGSDARPKRLITVARLVPRKNMARLIEEFSMIANDFADWKLQIVGDGGQLDALRAQAAPLGEQVIFEGHIEDPYPIYADAQLFVLPSLFEGFPMSGLEALAHGLPMVGYRVCNGLNQQIVEGRNGRLVADPSRRGSLAEALAELMSDAPLRTDMGTASLRRFRRHYAPPIITDQWEAMLQSATHAHAPLAIAAE